MNWCSFNVFLFHKVCDLQKDMPLHHTTTANLQHLTPFHTANTTVIHYIKKILHYLVFYSFALGSHMFLPSEVEFLQKPWLPTTFLSGHDELQISSWLFYNQRCGGLPADICCLAQMCASFLLPLSSVGCFQSLGCQCPLGG